MGNEVIGMKRNGNFMKFAFCPILFMLMVQIATSQSPKARLLKFSPPLKGTEILLEADQPKSELRRRGIWALDPETDKARFLIPNGSRPIWSPKRNYFAYRKYNFIHVVDVKGRIDAETEPGRAGDGELLGWGHNERWILYIAPVCRRIGWELLGNFVYLQTIKFARFNPKKPYMEDGGIVNVWEKFPLHHVGNASISPDGKYIAFEVFKYASGVGKLNSKIALAELREENGALLVKNIRRLTSLPMELMEINPKWSPDNKRIAFDVVNPGNGSRIAHVINLDGSELRGLRLYQEEIYPRVKGKEKLLRVEEGLVRESLMNKDLRVLDWLPDNRLAVVESKFILTRHVDRLDDRFGDCEGVWVVDFEKRHPPLLIPCLMGLGEIKFLFLSPDKKRLAIAGGVDEFIIFIELIDIPDPQNKGAMSIIHPHRATLKFPFSRRYLSSFESTVYWINW